MSADDPTKFVVVNNLSKSFEQEQHPALSHISFTFGKGQFVGLAGPDGAGKTTLIRLIAGLLLPSEGSIKVAGCDSVQQAEEIHHLIGYMPQKFGLYEDLSVKQNLDLYADLRGVSKEDRQQTYEKLLSFTSLGPFLDRLAGNLSGGMKQKLGLACALIKKPTLLLLDEPSVGVDPVSRRELWSMVKALVDEGISVLWSTAYLDEAEKCDHVLLLNQGKLLYDGTPSELTKRVQNRTFLISQLENNKREVLFQALNLPSVIDGVIQGNSVRILTKDISSIFPLDSLSAGANAIMGPIQPRFEDAFIDILGGGPGGTSLLAEKTPAIMEKSHSIIEAKELVKQFGSFTAVKDISFTIKSGEIFGLLGPNGAGKSTTFKMLCGLLKPTSGVALVNGYDLQQAPGQARSRIGYMAQKFSLYGNLSVKQNLEFYSGIYSLQGSLQKEMINEMIETFNFEPYLEDSADTLSLGFKQRLALSCALMHRPSVLFLDEPTSGVDPITRREFWNHINGLVEKSVTVMVTTHFMDEAEYCDQIGLVYRSQLIRMGTPDALKTEAISTELPNPTLEDAFIALIKQFDEEHNGHK